MRCDYWLESDNEHSILLTRHSMGSIQACLGKYWFYLETLNHLAVLVIVTNKYPCCFRGLRVAVSSIMIHNYMLFQWPVGELPDSTEVGKEKWENFYFYRFWRWAPPPRYHFNLSAFFFILYRLTQPMMLVLLLNTVNFQYWGQDRNFPWSPRSCCV